MGVLVKITMIGNILREKKITKSSIRGYGQSESNIKIWMKKR